MEWYEIEVNGRSTVKFPEKILPGVVSPAPTAEQEHDADIVHKSGGIIKRGEWAWQARGCKLQVLSLRRGQTMSTFEFAETKGYENCYIKCVEEIFPGNMESVFLAVCLQSYHNGPTGGGTYVALYSVEHSNVLSCMEMSLHINCARFMSAQACRRSLLQNFDGCLALGSEEGVVVLLDLNMRQILAAHQQQVVEEAFVPCNIIDYNLPLTEIHRRFRQSQQDGVHFGLQLEVIETPCAIQCLLPIDLILGLAIGLEDGRLAFYDLAELQIFYVTKPQQQQESSPVVKMDFLEPNDDPRPCFYVWAIHDNEENLSAVLHTLMYEKRLLEEDGLYYFESFQTSAVRLELPLEATKSVAIACQAISKLSTHTEDDANCLCALSWYSVLEDRNKLLLFDLNQWYKEQMPFALPWKKPASFLAGYVLSGQQCGLDAQLHPATIAHFNSMQRYEEHFYPTSLSFDCSLLLATGCRSYNWEGAQNKIINILRASNAAIFLDPDVYFNEIIRTRLIPQFCELQPGSTFSKTAKYELLLSVALEHNCYSLLRDCAKSWSDGSFLGNFSSSTGLSLSTLTEWLWKRATNIKTRCNDLCTGLFDYAGGYPMDAREQKELSFITRQLKLLADLLRDVLLFGRRIMPLKVYSALESKQKSLRTAADYQHMLLWLLNIGLLPEAPPMFDSVKSKRSTTKLVPYPYSQLKQMYTNKRAFFGKINENFISKKTGSCRLIYIDAFIEHACKGSGVLREYWLEHNGDGLYPPTTIESMLRVMLVPELDFDSKCAILLYFFLDLNMAIDEEAHKDVVANFIKFPSVFQLSASLIKTVQSFWNLDHGHFLPAVDEFVSPFNNNQNYPQWLLELLIEALLMQNAANLALRILEARPTLISPVLKLKTLLSNELISEAFHFARAKNDEALLELFFTCCLCAGKYGVIRDLALSEREGQLVQQILKRSKSPGAESLHFVYLLQKSKYLEAVSYMDELSKNKCMRANYANTSQMETPSLVLSAFNTTMTPVTQGLTDVYFRIKNKIKKKEADNQSPVPLSCQLIKQNANNLLGGIYHSSALSAHFATYYWGELESRKRDSHNLLSSNNAPFLRKPQTDTHHQLDYLAQSAISYPQVYKVNEKRSLADDELHNSSAEELERQAAKQNPKKRRRLLGQEIIDDLSHFMQMNKQANRTQNSEFSFQTAAEATEREEPETEECFLTQPVAKTQQASTSHSVSKSYATSGIHGILKTHTPEPTERYSARREDEEKSLRFKLPSMEYEVEETVTPKRTVRTIGAVETEQKVEQAATSRRLASAELEQEQPQHLRFKLPNVYIEKPPAAAIVATTSSTAQVNVDDDHNVDDDDNEDVDDNVDADVATDNAAADSTDDAEERMEVVVKLQPATSEVSETHRLHTRAISIESTGSSSSSKTTSDDNFYSPLSSQNVSLSLKQASETTSTPTSTLQQTASRLSSFLSGPQPRKPLARLSAERIEKSLTPEPRRSVAHMEKHSPTMTKMSPTKTGEQKSSSFTAKATLSPPVTTSAAPRTHYIPITLVDSLPSADVLHDFAPPVSSSKVCDTQTRFALDKTESPAQLATCETVVGSLSEFETTDSTFGGASNQTKLAPKTVASKTQMWDTTLGMSSYDLDATAVEVAPSCSSNMQTKATKQATVEAETKTSQPVLVNIYEDMETDAVESRRTNVQAEDETSSDDLAPKEVELYNEALGLPTSETKSQVTVAATTTAIEVISSPDAKSYPANDKSEDDAVIELSSSSSATSEMSLSTVEEDGQQPMDDSYGSGSELELLQAAAVDTDDDEDDVEDDVEDDDEDVDEDDVEDDDANVDVEADNLVDAEESAEELESTEDELSDDDAEITVTDEEVETAAESDADVDEVEVINDDDADSNDVAEIAQVTSEEKVAARAEEQGVVSAEEHVQVAVEYLETNDKQQEKDKEMEEVVEKLVTVPRKRPAISTANQQLIVEESVEEQEIVPERQTVHLEGDQEVLVKEKAVSLEELAEDQEVLVKEKAVALEERAVPIEIQEVIILKPAAVMKEQQVVTEQQADPLAAEQVITKECIVPIEVEAVAIKPVDPAAVVEKQAASMEAEKATTKALQEELAMEVPEVVITKPEDQQLVVGKQDVKMVVEESATGMEDREVYYEAQDLSFKREDSCAAENESADTKRLAKSSEELEADLNSESNLALTETLSLVGSENLLPGTHMYIERPLNADKAEDLSMNRSAELMEVSENVPEELMQTAEDIEVSETETAVPPKAEEEKLTEVTVAKEEVEHKSAPAEALKSQKVELNAALENAESQTSQKSNEDELHLHVDEEDIEDENVAVETASSKEQSLLKAAAEALPAKLSVEDATKATELDVLTAKERVESAETSPLAATTATKQLTETATTAEEEEEEESMTRRKRTRSISKSAASDEISTPKARKTLHGFSVPPVELSVVDEASVSTPHRRNTRGISVPPQTLVENEVVALLTPRARSGKRASSLQPKSQLEEEVSGAAELGTPRRRSGKRGTSVPPAADAGSSPKARGERGNSVKLTMHSRSTMFDKAVEEAASSYLDSPATRTRLRLRLSSMDSELDSSIVGSPQAMRRTRRSSISSSVSEQPQTPRRTRRSSISSARSAQAQDDDVDSIGSTPTSASAKRKQRTGKATAAALLETETTHDEHETDARKKQKSSPQEELANVSYSSSRRLTRTQLAVMEKSAALAARIAAGAGATTNISPPTARRVSNRRTSRSTNNTNQDSDDVESISSHRSSHVSSPALKRHYATRSSVKDKDEIDDDIVSVASSVGSERRSKRRSKEKSSPNTTLTVIPEEETEAHVEHKKRSRAPKKLQT